MSRKNKKTHRLCVICGKQVLPNNPHFNSRTNVCSEDCRRIRLYQRRKDWFNIHRQEIYAKKKNYRHKIAKQKKEAGPQTIV